MTNEQDFVYTRRIAFAEADPAGIAHFAQFPRWVEEAECAFWREHGILTPTVENGRLSGWPKVAFEIRYRSPIRHNDVVAVRLRPLVLSSDAVRWRFRIERDGALCANGEMTVVYAEGQPLKGELRKCPMPPHLTAVLGGVVAEAQ